MSVIITALSLGAVEFAKGMLSDAGKEAYQALKQAVLRVVSPRDVEKLEQNPNSKNRQGVVAEELENAAKAEDPELAQLALTLMFALKDRETLGEGTGIILEEVEAINVRLQNIIASGTGVSITKSKFDGDIEVSDVRAGIQPPGKPERR